MLVTEAIESAARGMYECWYRESNQQAAGLAADPRWADEPESVRAIWLKLVSIAIAAYSGGGEPVAFRAADELRAIVETAPLAIFGLDFNGNVTSWNPHAERMFGFTAAEVLNRELPIVPEGDREFFRTNLERPQRGETLAGVERKRRKKDGSLVDVAIWNVLQRGPGGEPVGVISIVADTTERKALEEQLRISQRLEAIGRLSAGIAHDFNNLLTVINGTSEMLLGDMGQQAPDREAIESILQAGQRAAELTRQLLAFGRRQMIAPEVLPLNSVLSELHPMLRRILGEDVVTVFDLSAESDSIRADRSQVEQIVLNLVVNARDAMPNGGRLVVATANVEINAREYDLVAGRYVMLKVSDTGCGMSADTQRRIFEPFFTTKPFGSATGLGLSTVYGIVKQHGGDISVDSEVGRGTAFSILFPPAGTRRSSSVPAPAGTNAPARKETILLVEDEPEVRRLAQRILLQQGYGVLDAENGREALNISAGFLGDIDLLLTDLVLPDLGGQDVARRAVRARPTLKVLFMSGKDDPAAASRGLMTGRFPLLGKPFTPEALTARVREVLDTRSV